MCLQLSILSNEKESLLNLWEVRRQQYEQCMDLQLFYRDTEQVDNWMSKQEVSFLSQQKLPFMAKLGLGFIWLWCELYRLFC